jgi:hypothetical protein
MRACFLGQNICALGFGVATLQVPPLLADEEAAKPALPAAGYKPVDQNRTPRSAVPQRPDANPL